MAEIIKIEAKKQALKSLTKVAAYARVSVDKARTLHSLSAQVSYYNKLIQNNPEWEYAGVYSDIKTPRLIQFNYSSADFSA